MLDSPMQQLILSTIRNVAWPSTGPPMLVRTALALYSASTGKTILKCRHYAGAGSSLACGLGYNNVEIIAYVPFQLCLRAKSGSLCYIVGLQVLS